MIPSARRLPAQASLPDALEQILEAQCIEVINTPAGSGVSTTPIDSTTGTAPVTLTFDNVTGAGNTSLVTGPTGPPPPGTFVTGDSTYYELSTTATFTGNIEVCITYDEGAVIGLESNLRILLYFYRMVAGKFVRTRKLVLLK